MTYQFALQAGSKILREAGIAEADLESWYLLEEVCQITRSDYYMHQQDELSEEQQNSFQTLLKERAKRIPLQYLLGKQEFMGLTFKVNTNVLIPRQDTEILVEEACKDLKEGQQVLDVCTGSGCIVISLMKQIPGLRGTGVDISKQALLVAMENGKTHGVEVDWFRSDLFENVEGTFDMIVSNPPYIPTNVIETLQPEVRDYEPFEALDGREDGLYFYRKIIAEAAFYLNENGMLLLEIGYDQGEAVASFMRRAGFRDIEIKKDLAGLDRVVKGRM